MPKYTTEDFERDLAARKEREAKEERDRRARVEKASARQRWLADGGREEDFEKAWPQLRDAARRKRVMSADEQARATQRARTVSNF